MTVETVTAYRGECRCGWFGALRGVPRAAEHDIAEHFEAKHPVSRDTSTEPRPADPLHRARGAAPEQPETAPTYADGYKAGVADEASPVEKP